jgi:hypothetical protein
LRQLGFAVTAESFEFSAFPGHLVTPAAGAGSMITLAAAGHWGSHNHAALALLALAAVGAPLTVGAGWMVRSGVLNFPWMRTRSTNLVAVRGVPSVWLVAHLDSKSQPVSIGVRALALTLTSIAWLLALTIAVCQLAGATVAGTWPWIAALGTLASIPVVASVVRARSPGALDDASGVVTVLLAARAIPAEMPIGIALTSAEELGLAGALAWSGGRSAQTAINVDGVDDTGTTRFMWTRRRPERLLRALLGAAAAHGGRARAARLLPGILTDSVALSNAGWDAVTVSRGTLATLARIHTARDTTSALDGSGIATTAAIIADALREIT